MSEGQDFERIWISRFADCLDQEVSEQTQEYILAGSEDLSSLTSTDEVIKWTREAMKRLEEKVDDPQRRDIMTGCACHYPSSNLQEIRAVYEGTGDLDLVHALLQEKFENFLEKDLGLEQDIIDEVTSRGWGLAGFKNGNTVIATKIPKSGDLRRYFEESDPDVRRGLYCHCPRVRTAVNASEKLPITYCYCGAGFYKDLWEQIIQQAVEVEVLGSVLVGDDECKIAIYLP